MCIRIHPSSVTVGAPGVFAEQIKSKSKCQKLKFGYRLLLGNLKLLALASGAPVTPVTNVITQNYKDLRIEVSF